jgi:inhibitor of KinA sporulation pathway (predicted exonuclease)
LSKVVKLAFFKHAVSVNFKENSMGSIVIADTEYWTNKGVMARGWSMPGEYRDLTEIGAIRIDTQTFEITDTFHRLIRPIFARPTPYMLALNRRTEEHFLGAPFFSQVIEEFFKFTGPCTVACYGEDGRVLVENMAMHRVNGFALRDDGKRIRVTFDKSGYCEEKENEITLALYSVQAQVAHRLSRGVYHLGIQKPAEMLAIRVIDILPWFSDAGIVTEKISSGQLAKFFGLPLEGECHHPVWDATSVARTAEHLIKQGHENFFATPYATEPVRINAKRPSSLLFSHPAASVAAPAYPDYL